MSDQDTVELFLLGRGVRRLPALVMEREGSDIRLRLDGLVDTGEPVCVAGRDSDLWLYGKVVAGGDGSAVVRLHGVHERHGVEHAFGPVSLRYQVLAPDAPAHAAQAWLAEGVGVRRRWVVPKPFVGFTNAGLQFEGGGSLDSGDKLLVGLQIPDHAPEHRLVAEVERSVDEGVRRTAIRFVSATPGAGPALDAFAARMQDALLELR